MAVLTAKTLEGIKRVFRLGNLTGCHPYKWNKLTGQAEICSSYFQKMLWIFNVALSIGQYAFIVFQWHQITSSETAGMGTKTFMRFALIFFSFPIFFQLSIITAWDDLPEFVSMYLRYNKQFEERYIVTADRRPKFLGKICEYIVVNTFSSFWVDFFAYVTLAFFNPSLPDQVSSLITTELLDPRRLLLFALFFYYLSNYVLNACLMIFTSFGFFFSAFQILQEFGPKRMWLKGRHPKVLIRLYRILYMGIQGVDRVYKIITAAAKIILMMLAIFCTFGGIRLHGLMAVTLGVIGMSTTIFLGVIMTAWSEFHSSSERALVGLKREIGNERGLRLKFLSRELKALRLLKIPVCGMYEIDKALVLRVIQIVCESIIFLLVNY